MKRSEARELAMQIIFQMEFQNDFTSDDHSGYLAGIDPGKQADYIKKLLDAVCTHIGDIDKKINSLSQGWPTSRMSKIDLSLLRLAAAEIMYLEDIPYSVSVNEAVELSKSYGTEKSPSFINGVLAKLSKQ